jgi:serine protease Do
MEQLIKNGKVRRGMLGVIIQDITSDVAESLELKDTKGVIVSNVNAGNAADKAGVKRGDIIVAINDDPISDGNSLRNKVAGTEPGSSITLKIIRDGQEKELKVTLGEFKIPGQKPLESEKGETKKEDSAKNGKLGLSLQPLTQELKQQLNVPTEVEGLIVTEVVESGAAAQKGIQKGDVIMEINRQKVGTLDDVQKVLAKSGDKPILLLISRNGQTTFIPIKPK